MTCQMKLLTAASFRALRATASQAALEAVEIEAKHHSMASLLPLLNGRGPRDSRLPPTETEGG